MRLKLILTGAPPREPSPKGSCEHRRARLCTNGAGCLPSVPCPPRSAGPRSQPSPSACVGEAEPGSSGGVSQIEITTKKYSCTDSFPGKRGGGAGGLSPGGGRGKGGESRGEPGRGDGPGRTPRLPRPPGVASLRLCPAAGRCPGGAPPGGGSVRASGRSQASLRRGVWLGAKAEGNAAQPPPTCSALARPGPAARSRWGPVTGGGSEMPELLP